MDERENIEVTEEVVSEETKSKRRSKKESSPEVKGMSAEELETFSKQPIAVPPQPLIISKVAEPEHVFQYKVDMYTPRGMLKAHISRPVFAEMSRKYGDIMRAIYINRWITAEEIITNYFTLNKRFKFGRNRTDDQIRSAVEEMVNAGLIMKR